MSIETDQTGTKNIKWTTPSGLIGLTAKSILVWLYPDDFGAAYEVFLINGSTATDEYNSLSTVVTSGRFGFVAHFSTTNGIWLTTSSAMTAGAWNFIAVTYDGASTSNDPVLYNAGVSVAVTRSTAPVGTYRTGTASDIYIGSATAGSNLDGKTALVLMYNRILSASEIADAYASRKAIPIRRGLVFAPILWGASGLQNFDGTALSTGNLIMDTASGLAGTPNGSPTARAETYLRIK